MAGPDTAAANFAAAASSAGTGPAAGESSWAGPLLVPGADVCLQANGSALAVSTSQGSSALLARDAGVPHVEDCALLTSPIAADAAPSALDDGHVHRLETSDRAEYARLTGLGGGPAPDRSQAWKTTVAAARLVLERAALIQDLAVPAVIREVVDALTGMWRCLRRGGASWSFRA